MRKGISKAERRKAMRVADKHAGVLDSDSGQLGTLPEFLDNGGYNAVYALSADLVLRIQQRAGEDNDTSWNFYEVAQLYPHPSLPTVWELGEFNGYKFAIVERMECTLHDLQARGRQVSLTASKANAVAHLRIVAPKNMVCDAHEYNIMKRRKKDEFVLVDCFLE